MMADMSRRWVYDINDRRLPVRQHQVRKLLDYSICDVLGPLGCFRDAWHFEALIEGHWQKVWLWDLLGSQIRDFIMLGLRVLVGRVLRAFKPVWFEHVLLPEVLRFDDQLADSVDLFDEVLRHEASDLVHLTELEQ